MATPRRWRPRVEPLDDRTLPSAVPGMTPIVLPLIPAGHHRAHHLTLIGQVSGTWGTQPGVPDAGARQTLTGSGTVQPLGAVEANGTLHLTGFIRRGEATGTLTLTNAQGSVRLKLVGPPQRGFSGPPATFHDKITGGTGAYAHATGRGTAGLTETTEFVRPPCPPGAVCPAIILVVRRFTLTFPALPA